MSCLNRLSASFQHEGAAAPPGVSFISNSSWLLEPGIWFFPSLSIKASNLRASFSSLSSSSSSFSSHSSSCRRMTHRLMMVGGCYSANWALGPFPFRTLDHTHTLPTIQSAACLICTLPVLRVRPQLSGVSIKPTMHHVGEVYTHRVIIKSNEMPVKKSQCEKNGSNMQML